MSDSVYVHGEDERLIIPLKEMLDNEMDQKEIITLIQNIPDELKVTVDLIMHKKMSWKMYLQAHFIFIHFLLNTPLIYKKKKLPQQPIY